MDVHIPTTRGRELAMPRYTEPEAPLEMILEKLALKLPKQPPPRIRTPEVILPTPPERDFVVQAWGVKTILPTP